MVLKENNILLNIRAKNKESVLRELVKVAQKDHPEINPETLHRLLLEREQIGSTGVGNGVAIPHARMNNIDAILLCFARTHTGIAYDAIDNQPVHFIIMILSPENKPDEYLKTLAAVSRHLKKPETRRRLRLARTRKKIVDIFKEFE